MRILNFHDIVSGFSFQIDLELEAARRETHQSIDGIPHELYTMLWRLCVMFCTFKTFMQLTPGLMDGVVADNRNRVQQCFRKIRLPNCVWQASTLSWATESLVAHMVAQPDATMSCNQAPPNHFVCSLPSSDKRNRESGHEPTISFWPREYEWHGSWYFEHRSSVKFQM